MTPAGHHLRVAALVVTHDRLPLLRITLERLLAEPVDHVLVVDNASSDGTADWLATEPDPRLTVLRLTENMGGAGGFEAGLAFLRDQVNPDWIVLMDDDARPEPGAISVFRREAAGIDPDLAEGSQNGVIVAAVLTPQGVICEMNRPSRNPFWHRRLLLRLLMGEGRAGFHLADACFAPDAGPAAVDAASFVGFFISRGALARAGLPDGALFLYGDDTIYSLKARRAGVAITLRPAVRFEHDCNSLDARLLMRPLWKVYYLSRNGVRMAREAAGPVLFPVALVWYLLAWWRKGRHYPLPERGVYYRLIRRGVMDGLRGRLGRNDAICDRVHSTPLSDP